MRFRSIIQYPGQRLVAFILSSVIALSVSSQAQAQDGLTESVERGSDLVKSIGVFGQLLFLTAGIFVAGWGVYALTIGRKNRQAQQENAMVPVLAIFGGVALSALIYGMGTVSQTLFGSNQVSVDQLGGF